MSGRLRLDGASPTTAAGAGAGPHADAGPGASSSARRRWSTRGRKGHLPAVYWGMAVLMLLCTLGVSLLFIRLLFWLHLLIAPGPVLLLGTFSIASLIAGALFSQIFVRSITRPILEMSAAAERIAQGDFDVELNEKTFALEIEEMQQNFTVMADELASTELLRSDFVSNVSHEMKTPIASIMGYAALLERPELDDEARLGYAGAIRRSSRRLSSLTDDVLLLSRLENHGGELQREPFDLTEQLRETILLFEPVWSDGERELELDLEEVEFCGNVELLAHVWQNLIGNAVKFSRTGDRVSVRLERLAPAAGGEGDVSGSGGVRVQVADAGVGMSPEECARVFEKFYQADRSHATEGNGLGLALAQRIVEVHGGDIAVESALGRGSVFTVELPAR